MTFVSPRARVKWCRKLSCDRLATSYRLNDLGRFFSDDLETRLIPQYYCGVHRREMTMTGKRFGARSIKWWPIRCPLGRARADVLASDDLSRSHFKD